MTLDQFMHFAFWVWLFIAVSFVFFLIGRFVGYKEGYADAEALYKIHWKNK